MLFLRASCAISSTTHSGNDTASTETYPNLRPGVRELEVSPQEALAELVGLLNCRLGDSPRHITHFDPSHPHFDGASSVKITTGNGLNIILAPVTSSDGALVSGWYAW